MNTSKVIHILDGGMGTMLQQAGMKSGQVPELLNVEKPEMVKEVHKAFIREGSDIIYTCTFGANRKKLPQENVEDIVKAAVANAKEAVGNQDVKIALDIGPIGEMLEPMGSLTFEEAYDIFKEIIDAGKDGVDYIVFETMTDLYEVKAGVLAAKENSDLPILVSMSFEEDGRTFAGVSLESFVNGIGGLGISAIGINCSLGPLQMKPMVRRLSEITDLDLIVKPNAGLPNMDGTYDLEAEEFASAMEEIYQMGVKYLGGCCGSNEKHMRLLSRVLKGKKLIERKTQPITGPSSGTKFVGNKDILVVGERLNPTGKKSFQEALKNQDIDYPVREGLEQADGGADVLDLNVGHPGIDEEKMMAKLVKSLQAVLETPIQIDSSKPEAIEAGLRVYNGKAIVNSVNGEDEKLDEILPLVKKYNAQIIGLTLDENGVAEKAEDRFKIAEKIVKRALEYGISRDDIYIDCLTLTLSSEAEGAKETLKTIRLVKENLGVKTALGVSNISFGLPNRDLINSGFLLLALEAGLDMAIINPNSKVMMDMIHVFRLIQNQAGATEDFIKEYADIEMDQNDRTGSYDLVTAIRRGLNDQVQGNVKRLLGSMEELDIVDKFMIPALDLVGEDYEDGEIFLPQLIKSADAAHDGFEIIRHSITEKGLDSISKGDIIVATVKGDVHDIGKNIAKVILENYGYNVYDLGKDVDPDEIVSFALEKNIKLVGLSALMTTSLDSMEETILKLKEADSSIKVMVGGAVLSEEYSDRLGADYYVKDAKADVDVAREVFGE